jgi:hypothetical protein
MGAKLEISLDQIYKLSFGGNWMTKGIRSMNRYINLYNFARSVYESERPKRL